MAKKSRHRANGTKQAKRFHIGPHRRKMLAATKKGPLIPESVLKKLAALNLPDNVFVYEACLAALLRDA